MPTTKQTTKKKAAITLEERNGKWVDGQKQRLKVSKTYKIYIGGNFVRSESGRYFIFKSNDGKPLANICRSTKKDFRDSVKAARNAQSNWAKKTAYNRGQILYRLAEMMEGRTIQFVDELMQQGLSKTEAEREVVAAIDRMLYYAGWADKYQQVFSSVNPVAASYFNFSILEPTGVAVVIAPQERGLIGLVSVIAPVLVGGNTCVVLASNQSPLSAVSFAEVINSSDVPGGVINILTGFEDELLEHFASHMDVNAIVYCGEDRKTIKQIQELASTNVKRVILHKEKKWLSDQAQSPYYILQTQEVKTTWHPVGI